MLFYNQYRIKKVKGAFNRPLYEFEQCGSKYYYISLKSALNQIKSVTETQRRRQKKNDTI
jgi:hypothetical protein